MVEKAQMAVNSGIPQIFNRTSEPRVFGSARQVVSFFSSLSSVYYQLAIQASAQWLFLEKSIIIEGLELCTWEADLDASGVFWTEEAQPEASGKPLLVWEADRGPVTINTAGTRRACSAYMMT